MSKTMPTMKRLVAILLACSHFAMATEASIHWRDLGPMITGKDVILSLADGKRIKGRTASVDADSLAIEMAKGRRQSVPRNLVREIRVTRKSSSKWRVIGTALGGGIGAAIAVPVLAETHNEGSGSYDGAAVGLVAGLAALGFLAGWSGDHGRDVIRILPD
jgi:hypothetical protein